MCEFNGRKMSKGDSRIVQDSPAMLNNSGNGNQVQNLTVVHHMAIREVHLIEPKD
jgi:hypothetical protein